MQQVGARKALGYHVAGLHQLQRKLEGAGVVQAAAQHDGVLHEPIALGAAGDIKLERKRAAGPFRNPRQIVQRNIGAQCVSEQIQQQQLPGVGFRRGDALFAAGMHQEQVLRDLRQCAGSLGGDPDSARALIAGPLQHDVGIGGLTGLRNRHHQYAIEAERSVVEREDGRRGQGHGNSSGHLEQVAPELRRIVGSAARGQHDQTRRIALQNLAQFFDGPALGL